MVLPATPDHAGAHFVVAGPRELWAWGFSKKGISAEEAATIASILDVDPKQMKPSEMTTDVLLHWDGTAFRIEEPPTHITGMAGGKGTLFALGMNGTILQVLPIPTTDSTPTRPWCASAEALHRRQAEAEPQRHLGRHAQEGLEDALLRLVGEPRGRCCAPRSGPRRCAPPPRAPRRGAAARRCLDCV
jgi:hypothetical protein